MRPSLRRTFLEIVLMVAAAAPLAGCPWGDCPGEDGSEELVEPTDAELQALIDACRAAGGYDLAACEPMCHELIVRQTRAEPFDTVTWCELADDTDPNTAVTAFASWTVGPRCIGGRRPAGYAGSGVDQGTVGGFFAEQARLEAASVRAFLDLARGLAAHGAPQVLIEACHRAAAQEIVHAALTARLARAAGVAPRLADVPPAPVPTLEELARANAVEGCVREAWGALVATWQARAAADPAVRAAMRRIAPDETAHATLSRAIHRWAMRHLGDAARARVETARADAVAELAASVLAAPTEALERDAGLPDAATAARLFEGLQGALAA